MRILEISTVVGCSIACAYCPQKTHVTNYAARSSEFRMSLDTFKKCLSTIPSDVEIQFAGMAEPWLNPECTDMVLHALVKSHSVGIYTTCVGMTMWTVARLKYYPLRIFCIHLPDDAGQMKLKIDQNYLDVVKACIKNIPTCSLMCVGTVHPHVRAILDKDVTNWTSGLISRAGNLPVIKDIYKSGPLKQLPCMEHNVLLPNGDVVLCCCDYSQKHIIGNLTRQSYEELFSGTEFQRIIKGLKDESEAIICRKCEIAECEK